MITIRKAMPSDNIYFAELMLLSAPYFPSIFGKDIKTALQNIFCYKNNLFSFEHTTVVDVDGKVAGMFLGYNWEAKREQNINTGFLLIKELKIQLLWKLPYLLRFNSTVGRIAKFEYYLSNVAVYKKYRNRGLGKMLLLVAEKQALKLQAKKIVLDVEEENTIALRLYEKLGYKYENKFSIKLTDEHTIRLIRLSKAIKQYTHSNT